ncbi:hypothetical protein TMatcc_007297 [Talaromyces marneffei ATCC 18224]
MPRYRGDGLGMAFKRMQFGFQVAKIEQSYGLVCRSCSQDGFGSGIECDRIDGIPVLSLCNSGSSGCVGISNIDDLKGNVVRHRTDQRCVERVVLDVVHNGRVMRISPGRSDGFVAFGVCFYIPALTISSLRPITLKCKLPTRVAPSYLHFQSPVFPQHEDSSLVRNLPLYVLTAPTGG